MKDVELLIDKYYKWLRDGTSLKQNENFVEITTPYLDRHNDHIRIYLVKDGDNLFLSDEGETIDDLLLSGCIIDTPKRKKILEYNLNGFGVKMDNNNKLMVKATVDTFALKKHCLIQSILAINDMFYLTEANVKSLFFEDVKKFFDSSDIRYTENVIFKGRSGFDRKFDFVIPKSKKAPERIIKTINSLNKNTANLFIMDWIDTKDIRPDFSKPIALINDGRLDEIKNLPDICSALNSYGIDSYPWSKKEEFISELSA